MGVYGLLRVAPQGDPVLWVLANVKGFKDAAAGRMRQQYVPVSDVEVAVRIPDGRQVKEMRLIRANKRIPFKEDGGYAVGVIPTVHIAEIAGVLTLPYGRGSVRCPLVDARGAIRTRSSSSDPRSTQASSKSVDSYD